jgi:hypothetical protein
MIARDLARRAVLATNPHWPFSALNRWPYRAAIAAAARRMRRLGSVRALCLRNSLTRADWVPGLSDIDLTLVVEPIADVGADYERLRSIWHEHAALKRAFPMLGEMDVLTTTTLGAWSRFGIAGHETRQWRCVFGSVPEGLGPAAGGQRHAFDACNHALYFCIGVLQTRMFEGEGASLLSARELRRVAEKVAAYAALARGEARDASPLPAGATTPAGVAAAALWRLDATVRSVDLSGVWADPPAGAFVAIEGADAALPPDDRPAPQRRLPADLRDVEAVVDGEQARIVVLRAGLDARAMEAAFAGIARVADRGGLPVKVVTPAVFAHWVRCLDPYSYTGLLQSGRAAHGRSVRLPAPPHERSFAHGLLWQASNAIVAARSGDLLPPRAAAFLRDGDFARTVNRALFARTLVECGTVSPWHAGLAAEARRLHGDVLARADATRARAERDATGAALEAFELLREVAEGTAAAIERSDAGALVFRPGA